MAYDTIIVGGGPAGLNAALVLGRSRRRVLVVDAGRPRNYASHHAHNFLSRDGIHPGRLLDLGRRDLVPYDVEFRSGVVTGATCAPEGFVVKIGREKLRSRTLLLATGVVDDLPEIPNLPGFYGLGVHHCPYCDGWEYRDRRIAVFGRGRRGLGLALNLLTWSRDLVIVTDGERLPVGAVREAEQYGIRVRTDRIAGLFSRRGRAIGTLRDPLGFLSFQSGEDLPVDAVFFNTDKYQRSRLPMELGCRTNDSGGVVHDRKQRTGVPGLYLAGDVSFDVQFVIVAAAEGAKAGVAINRELQERDRAVITRSRRSSAV